MSGAYTSTPPVGLQDLFYDDHYFYVTGEYWESQNCNTPLLTDFSGPEFRTVQLIIIQLVRKLVTPSVTAI
jgi:hypothetical protein